MDYTQSNVLSMTGGTDFATVAQLGNYVTLSTTQSVSGLKTFTTLPQSSVVPTTGNQLTNKTYVDGLGSVYVTLSTAQTISGLKTFSGNVRINNTRGLILGTTYPTAGGFINYTTPNVYYDVTGGSHLFFVGGTPTVDLDTGGLTIRTSKKLNFYGGSWIYEDSAASHLDYNTPTGFYHSLRINNVEQLKIDATASTFIKDIKMKLGSYFYVDDAFTSGTLTGDNNGGIRFDSGVGAGFSFYSNSAPVLTIEPTKVIQPTDTVWQFGVTGASIGYVSATTSLNYNVPISKTHKFFVNSIQQLSIDPSGAILGTATNNNYLYLDSTKTNAIKANNGGAVFGSVEIYYGSSASLLLYGGTAGALSETINVSGFTLYRDNGGLVMGLTNGATTCRIQQATSTTSLNYTVPTGWTHRIRVSTTNALEVLATGVKVAGGYFCKAGGGAFGTNVLNTFWTGALLQCWIDTTNVGNFTISDYRVKENIQPARDVLERLCKVEMIEYELKDVGIFKKCGTHHGFIAHQVQELFPELNNIVSGEKDAVDKETGEMQPQTINSEWTNLYLKAIQELNAKIEAQQKQIDGLVLALSKIVSP